MRDTVTTARCVDINQRLMLEWSVLAGDLGGNYSLNEVKGIDSSPYQKENDDENLD